VTITQLNAIRTLWNDVTTPEQTRTAREMALTSHRLDRTGDRATTPDGRVWMWDARRELWVS
jgi:hypothetical protein